MKNIVLLPDIRSAHNVGSIFRTCDAAGIDHIILTGHTPLPIDRFGRPRKDIAKVALGAEQTVSWEYHENVTETLDQFKKEGFQIIGVEQDSRSIDYREVSLSDKNLFVFGREVEGIAPEILQQCDIIAEIPMHGKKESLNISVAVGVMLFGVKK